ncbi:Trichothecene efflux pump TRI12 [Pseudocercospora fuligena]|uniref:Trichothecene efflux pump TRI12 n=1 Tax=Pseudocercospora fuligena TaxID=685502 RepID=A0A8H6RGN4_9PEZI|nr:Trichothecene efflux pump TRI12 [Pseudocercospora fuligena]
MADIEKTVQDPEQHPEGHYGALPEHLEEMARTHTNIDVIHTTTENPYFQLNFIGTDVAIALATCASFAGFVMPVTALSLINAEIGPSPNSTWVALAWVLTSSVAFTLIGRLSDLFGRRYFFAGCSGLATIGCIIGRTANDINQLIGASVFLGLGSAGQISFNYVLGKLVPVRHRYAANGLIFLATFPFAGLGPYVARLLIEKSSSGWRGIYYLVLALDAAATLCWLALYWPPKFENLHRNRTKMQEVRELDFGGIVLFTGGLLLFLLGLSWGGVLHPWGSGSFLGTLITGGIVMIIFVLYELFVPLRRPLIPMHVFTNYDYNIVNVLSIVGGMVYYAASVLFPVMVEALYTQNIIEGGLISCAIGGGVCCGQFIGSWIAVPGGRMKYKLVFSAAGLTAFTAGLAGCTANKAAGSALATLAGVCIGVIEVMVSTTVTIVLDDQSELGTGAGVFGSLRAAGGVLATAIYSTIFMNRLTDNIKSNVAPALVEAGLPVTSVEPFLTAVQAQSSAAIAKVPGVSPTIIETGITALTQAYAQSFKITWLATISFGGLAVIAACLSRDIDDKLSHDVIRRLSAGYGKRKPETDSTAREKGAVEHIETASSH